MVDHFYESIQLDPLSDILSLVKARGLASTGLTAGGRWSVAVDAYDGLKFNAVVQGSAWLKPEDAPWRRLDAGDCFLLTDGRPFVLAAAKDIPPVPASEVFADTDADGMARIGEMADVVVLGGKLELEDPARLLRGALPPLLMLPGGVEGASTMRWLLERLAAEARSLRPGRDAVSDHLIHWMVIELMRAHDADGAMDPSWLNGLRDPRLSLALQAFHEAPAAPWTLAALARAAGLSRAGFAARFRRVVGETPAAYLMKLRLQRAALALRETDRTIDEIARSVGYGSHAAFAVAFQRAHGMAPGRYRRQSGAPSGDAPAAPGQKAKRAPTRTPPPVRSSPKAPVPVA